MSETSQPWYRSTFALAAASAVLIWVSLPPVNLWRLAWIAPVGLVVLIRRKGIGGRRPYRALWTAGFLFWLAAMHWLTLPHPATSFGWIALSFYLGFYFPVFVGLGRVAVHRLRIPVILAAPVIWTGLELARAHLLTGITMASLSHTQFRWIELIQMSDIAGAYGVDFVILLVAACLARMLPCDGRAWTVWPLAPAVVVLAAAVLYGHFRVRADDSVRGDRIRVALIQGSIDAKMKSDAKQHQKVFDHYYRLSRQAIDEYGPVDAIVWPETMFRNALITYENDVTKPELFDGSEEEFQCLLRKNAQDNRYMIRRTAAALGVPLILGIDRRHFRADSLQAYNSAVHVAADGEVLGHYDKMHLVLFGEYIPLADTLPWLHHLTPLPGSLNAGDEPTTFQLGPLRVAPNICYETVLPHVIRRQVKSLRDNGTEPDVLVNLTNDGWFWGSAELDMHLICGVFRAVECRKPLLIAANTGFSAQIDAEGRILSQGPRRATGTILAEVGRDGRQSFYLWCGDWPAGICLLACVALGLVAGRDWIRGRSRTGEKEHT